MRSVALLIALVLSMALPAGAGDGSYRGGSYDVSSGSYRGVETTEIDTTKILLTYADVTHDRSEYNTFASEADTLMLLEDIGFRYAYFYWSDPTNYGNSTNYMSFTAGYPGWADVDSTTGVGTRQLLFHLDYSALGIPEDATILRAEMKLNVTQGFGWNVADSLGIVMMDSPADSVWLNADIHSTLELLSRTSWNHADVDANTLWPIWYTDRMSPHQWGDLETWEGITASDGAWTGVITFDLTEMCQNSIDGGNNFGHRFIGTESSYEVVQGPAWGSDTLPSGFSWFEIEYSTRKYRSRFPDGAEWAFVFSTDDNILTINDTNSEIFADRGYRYTIFCKGGDGETGGTYDGYERAGYDDLVRWFDLGMEIGYHTYRHIRVDLGASPSGLASYDGRGLNVVAWTAGAHPETVMSDPACTGYDSLLADCDPGWFTSQVESTQGRSLSGSPRWMKSFALAYHHYTPQALVALEHVGYRAIRGEAETEIAAEVTLPSGHYDWPGLARWVPAGTEADSVRAGRFHVDPTREMNLWMTGVNYNILNLTGDPNGAGYEASSADVEENLRLVLENFRSRGRDALVVYDHVDVDSTRIEWLLDAVEAHNGAVMSVGDYIAWITGRADATATPSGYAQNDTMKFEAEDRTWFTPWSSHYKE